MSESLGNIDQASARPFEDESYSFLPIAGVKKALSALLESRIHPHFAGYLALCRAAKQSGSRTDLQFRPKEFFDTFLRVQGAPETTPYILPFRARLGKESIFFNANIAGSYAPSSLRDVAPFRRVADIAGARGSTVVSLTEDHASKALEHLLFKQRVSIAPLAVFLYRDFGFILTSPEPDAAIQVFREDFGFRSERAAEADNFKTIFSTDSEPFDSAFALGGQA